MFGEWKDIEQVFGDDLQLKLVIFPEVVFSPSSSPWWAKTYLLTSTQQCLLNTERALSVAVEPTESVEDSLEEERIQRTKTER